MSKTLGGRFRRRRRLTLGATVIGALALAAGVAQAQSPAPSPAPVCTAQETFIGNAPPNSVQVIFNCNQSLSSFKVDVNKALGSTPSGAQVEKNGASEPPPQGFACSPNSGSPKSFSCSGSANTGNTVRVTMNTQDNPCASPPFAASVTVGTGQSDSSGNPGGTTSKFSAGSLQGCSAPQPTPTPTPTPKKKHHGHRGHHKGHHKKHKKHH